MRSGFHGACDFCHDHWHILRQADEDHRAVRMKVVAETNFVAPMNLNSGDIDPQPGWDATGTK